MGGSSNPEFIAYNSNNIDKRLFGLQGI
jgi:hypothetical protein